MSHARHRTVVNSGIRFAVRELWLLVERYGPDLAFDRGYPGHQWVCRIIGKANEVGGKDAVRQVFAEIEQRLAEQAGDTLAAHHALKCLRSRIEDVLGDGASEVTGRPEGVFFA